MSDVSTYAAPGISSLRGAAPSAPAQAGKGLSFSDILSDLNPLQYLPVIGTIYRAITGDTVPKPLREAGSVLVGGLMGGPIGVAMSLATLAFEKLTGIDLEDVEQRVIASLMPSQPAPAPAPASAPEPAAPETAAQEPGTPELGTQAPGKPWTPTQLIAYGVVTRSDGTLQQGTVSGADVLNALQLQLIRKPPSRDAAEAAAQHAQR